MLTCAVAFACSSKSSDGGAVDTTPRPDTGACIQACCELPAPNTSCASFEAGTTCSYATTCPEGLVVSRSTACQSGNWKLVSDCPAPGGVDDQGCPSAQPAPKTPCGPFDGGSFPTCGYSKTCAAKVCDGSVCQQIIESATATCVNGMWQTTPLGPC